jgi:hypothetical protein
MLEATDQWNKMLVASINKIHNANLEIKKQCSQIQEKFQN